MGGAAGYHADLQIRRRAGVIKGHAGRQGNRWSKLIDRVRRVRNRNIHIHERADCAQRQMTRIDRRGDVHLRQYAGFFADAGAAGVTARFVRGDELIGDAAAGRATPLRRGGIGAAGDIVACRAASEGRDQRVILRHARL